MTEYQSSGALGRAALKAGMDRKTARRYLRSAKTPGELRAPHTWRTRDDPLSSVWPDAEMWLRETPELEAKALFEHLLVGRPGELDPRSLRTFQRRVLEWRRRHGPPKEVFFPQVHALGECIQTDWTNANELKVTIGGARYDHLLCHSVLPPSNWEWAIPCQSESILSLKAGLQASLWELGGIPEYSQTDQSSTATHQLKRGESRRGFNTEYLALCEHLGLKPRTIAVRDPNQNGDVEAAQRHIKRRLKNHLLLRRSRDFESQAAYIAFVAHVCRGANALREAKANEERATLRPLPPSRFPETDRVSVRISSFSTARVRGCAYSVPSRLIGSIVQAEVSESTVQFFYLGELVASYPRSLGRLPRIDYRHVIASLVRKPGAFQRYLYREELFPRPVFRQAYDRLVDLEERKASERYLELLFLAADFSEDRVADLLGHHLRAGEPPLATLLEPVLREPAPVLPTDVAVFTPELRSYDQLITEVAS